MSKRADVMSLMKSKAYIYIDGKTATFWGDFEDEAVIPTWHTLLRIKSDLHAQVAKYEAKYFPVPPKKRGRPSNK